MESDKRCSFTSSSPSPSPSSSSSYSSSSASEERVVRFVKTEEIEAAETLTDLAQLAMRQTHSADKCCPKRDSSRFMRDPPIPNSDLSRFPTPPGGQAVAGQLLDEKISATTSVETERINVKIEQDADLPKTTRCGKSRRNLTEKEKEARRMRRVLANRESARQTIRRRQALSEELSRKAAALALENENLKREKELALKGYQSLETTNKLLKAQIAKSINTKVEKTPVEQEELALKEYQSFETTNKLLKAQIAKSINTEVEKTPVEQELSVAEVTPMSGNSPWFLYNHFPVTQLFWPSILQSSNPFQLQHTPFNSIAIPPNVYVPCSSESESCHKQNNLINDNRTQNPLYMFPCPWLYPLPEFGNGQSPPSSSLKDKQENLPLGKQCSTSLSLNTVVNGDHQATIPIKLKTEVSGWTEAISINDPGHAAPSFSLDGGEQKTRCHMIEKFHGPTLGCNGHASAVKQEPELQLYSGPNTNVSSTASHIATSSLEKKQEQFICPGKNLVDAVAAAEARKRRRELTKLKCIQSRQSRMEC